jgi:hypothetical protein
VTTLQQLVLSMTPSVNNDPKPWTCAFTGSRTNNNKDSFVFTGHLEVQTEVITSPNTIHRCITESCIHTIFIHLLHRSSKKKQLSRGKQKYTVASLIGEIRGLLQGLGEGVLILPQDPGLRPLQSRVGWHTNLRQIRIQIWPPLLSSHKLVVSVCECLFRHTPPQQYQS